MAKTPRPITSRTYVDDNFGTWDIEDEEDLDFYHRVQEESVEVQCAGCCRTVRLRPHYAYCDSCATKIEHGGELSPCERQDCKQCNPPLTDEQKRELGIGDDADETEETEETK